MITINKKKRNIEVFDIINLVLLTILSFIFIYPFIYALAGSFSNAVDYIRGDVWFFPKGFTTASYQAVFMDLQLWVSYKNTIFRTFSTTILALFFTSMVAYPMSRSELRFRKLFWWLNLVTMFVSGGLIPYFLVINSIGLYNTFWVYVIPSIYSVYNMIIISNFYKNVPKEMREAAKIDGAGEVRIWLQFYIPMSKAVLATVSLWIATGQWNNYTVTLFYTDISNGSLITLQYYLYRVIKEAGAEYGGLSPDLKEKVSSGTVSLAAVIVGSLPILVIYPFIMKFFEKGVLLGGIKE